MRQSPVISRLLRLICVLAVSAGSLVVASGSPVGAAPAPSPWLQGGHDAGNTFANAAETRIAKWNFSTLTQRWSVTVPTDVSGCGGYRVALSESHVYEISQHVLTKHNIEDGSIVWSNHAPLIAGSFVQSLAVSGGRIVVVLGDCSSSPDVKEHVVAFDAATGAQVWSRTRTSYTSAFVAGNSVLLQSAGDSTVVRTSNGSLVWHQQNTDECNIDPRIVDGQILTTVCDSLFNHVGLRSRSLADGSITWTRTGIDSFGVRAATDSASGPHAYVWDAAAHRTVDIDPRTGVTRFALVGSWAGQLAVDGTRVYGTCDRLGAVLCAWDVATGKFLWKVSFPDLYVTGVIVTGTLLYINDFSTTYVVKPDTGLEVSTLPLQLVAAGSGHLVGYLDGYPNDSHLGLYATSNVA